MSGLAMRRQNNRMKSPRTPKLFVETVARMAGESPRQIGCVAGVYVVD